MGVVLMTKEKQEYYLKYNIGSPNNMFIKPSVEIKKFDSMEALNAFIEEKKLNPFYLEAWKGVEIKLGVKAEEDDNER
jgi:hypothetical protein